MKTRPLHPSLALLATLVGCATFEHQTTETEPHALISVFKPRDATLLAGVLKSLDGKPVRAGQTYRLRPGQHEVVVEYKEPLSDEQLSEKGKLQPNEQPAWARPQSTVVPIAVVGFEVHSRRGLLVTNSISVEAGGRYELFGDRILPK